MLSIEAQGILTTKFVGSIVRIITSPVYQCSSLQFLLYHNDLYENKEDYDFVTILKISTLELVKFYLLLKW